MAATEYKPSTSMLVGLPHVARSGMTDVECDDKVAWHCRFAPGSKGPDVDVDLGLWKGWLIRSSTLESG